MTRARSARRAAPTVHLEVAVLDDVEVTANGYVLVAGHLVGWVRPHRAGWTAVVAGAAAYVPPTVGLAQTVDRLLRHPERGGPVLLEHLSPASATRLLVQLGALEDHRRGEPAGQAPVGAGGCR